MKVDWIRTLEANAFFLVWTAAGMDPTAAVIAIGIWMGLSWKLRPQQ